MLFHSLFSPMITVILIFLSQIKHPAHKVPSDCKEAQLLVDLWNSATSISGAQFVVITIGDLLMPKLHADSKKFLLVELQLIQNMLFLKPLELAG